MAADRTRVLKRVTEILNLCLPGEYSSTLSTRNKTRNATAIADFVDEAGLVILKAIAERPNEFRYQFLSDSSPITTSGDPMPAHLGPPASVQIELYDGGPIVEGKQLPHDKIQAFRENIESLYDETAHDEEGSTLGGYFDIWSDRFFFSGFEAILSLARLPVRADTTTLIPEIFESTWIKLALGNAAKVGTGGYEASVISSYLQQGMADMQAFIEGKRVFPEVDVPTGTPPAHVVA